MFNYNRDFNTNTNLNMTNQHLLFEQKTDHDKDLAALASAKADCIMLRSNNSCTVNDCKHCSTDQRIRICMNELAICDQIRVDQMANNIAATSTYFIKKHKTSNRCAIVLCVVLACMIILGIAFCFYKAGGA